MRQVLRLAVGDVQIKVDEDIVTAEGYQDLKGGAGLVHDGA